jgi:hypothetical protein
MILGERKKKIALEVAKVDRALAFIQFHQPAEFGSTVAVHSACHRWAFSMGTTDDQKK